MKDDVRKKKIRMWKKAGKESEKEAEKPRIWTPNTDARTYVGGSSPTQKGSSTFNPFVCGPVVQNVSSYNRSNGEGMAQSASRDNPGCGCHSLVYIVEAESRITPLRGGQKANSTASIHMERHILGRRSAARSRRLGLPRDPD